MIQFFKFACVGIANTLVDLGVLNFLLFLTGTHTTGLGYIACKAGSFAAAVINSYFLNKYWVFRQQTERAPALSNQNERTIFVAVSLAGLLVNTAVSGFAFGAMQQLWTGISPALAANLGALIGTVAVLAFNFFGYKRLVFRTSPLSQSAS